MSNRQSRAQLRLLVTTLQNAGYDAHEVSEKGTANFTRATRVLVRSAPRSGLSVDEQRGYAPTIDVWFEGSDKLDRVFTSVDDAIRYYARTLRSQKRGLSLKTRAYPHHGEGDKLPLPGSPRANPVGRGALTSDEDRLKSFATRMRKESFVVRPGRDSLEIHATARGYVTFTLLTNQRYNVQQMDDGDTSKNERLANYWLAEERAAFLARSLRDGQAAAMRAKKTDARYRVALPNPTPIAHERAKRDAISAASRAVKGATFTAKIVPYTNGGMKTL